jgi:hypothetical protein
MARKVPNGFLYFVRDGDVDIDRAVEKTLNDRLGSWNKREATLFDQKGVLVTGVMMSGAVEIIQEPAQAWIESADHPGLFVGMWNDRRPTAEDLKRPEPVLGAQVKMLTGEAWTLPCLLYDTGKGPESMVPSRMVYRQGEWHTVVREEFLPIGERSLRIYEAIVDLLTAAKEKRKPRHELSLWQLADFVSAGLTVNYRVGREEIGLLGLFDPDQILQYAGAMVGKNMLGEMLKIAEGQQGLGESV